jgi:hypothetical protein
MTMNGANQRFMAGKTNWLASHLIVYSVTQAGSDTRNPFRQALGSVNTTLPIHQFDLRKIGDIINNGGAAKAYELRELNEQVGNTARNVTGSTHPINAYFLPWGDGSTFSGQLGINAEYFFTPTLNGCTFAHEGNGPNVSVAHANFVGGNQLTDQNAINNDLAQKFGHAPATTLIKTNYKPAVYAQGAMDYRAMVIGVRTGNNWSFYYQNYHVGLNNNKMVYTGVGLCTQI